MSPDYSRIITYKVIYGHLRLSLVHPHLFRQTPPPPRKGHMDSGRLADDARPIGDRPDSAGTGAKTCGITKPGTGTDNRRPTGFMGENAKGGFGPAVERASCAAYPGCDCRRRCTDVGYGARVPETTQAPHSGACLHAA
ncbi:hypothetical protein Dvul_0500 [Nitratidesulfovibrio vulgaris DP4]|uniref:Uncharacterized protein n=1 Tax=Nitratidesulfovibrio vulgaris (strain DP4) TaxID=391774 RepID=A0A0H3A5D7_NITV4|nr:hypothetical protein Dvul_0500 [Nitratidesulfovibrio vulgaris DP4]